MLNNLPVVIPSLYAQETVRPVNKKQEEEFNSSIEQIQAYLTKHYEFRLKLRGLKSNSIIWKIMSSTVY